MREWSKQPLVVARGPGEVDWWSKLLVHVAWVLGKANDVNVDNVAFWSPFRCHGSTPKVPSSDSQKVPLEAHVMSKCPDARDCLRQLVIPAMEQVSNLVDFDLSFIAR